MKLLSFKFVCLLIISLLLFTLAYIYILIEDSFSCSNNERNFISKLCEDTSKMQPLVPINAFKFMTSINLCSLLCSNNIQISCFTFHLNKPFVFIVETNTGDLKKFVVKSVINDNGEHQAYWLEDNTGNIPPLEQLKYMVSSQILSLLGRSNDNRLSEIDIISFYSAAVDLKSHEEFWKLLNDHEFLTAYLFQNYNMFPRIYGICSNLYAVEYAKPLIENPILPLFIPWKARIRRSIELLQLINKFETVWDEPLHLCDMKLDHFGWNEKGEVLFLDLDSVVTESFLTKNVMKSQKCSSDEDCSYFDCVGKCLPSNVCSSKKINTNLMSLCDKIFLGNSDAVFTSLSGLLTGYYFSKSIKDVLEICSNNNNMTVDYLIEALRTEYNYLQKYYEEL